MNAEFPPKKLAEKAERAYRAGDLAEAAEAFEAAALAYQNQSQTILAAEMWNNYAVILIQVGRGEEAVKAVEATLPLLQEGGDLERLGVALGNLAAALEACGRDAEAEQAYLQSAEILEKCGKAELRMHALKALSQLQLKQGKQLQALATFQSALEETPNLSLTQKMLKKLVDIPWKLLPK